MTDNPQKACDLCGLPVETPDFSLLTVNGLKQFCCEGCHGIYQMLHEGDILGDGNATLATGEGGQH
ncbi:MAG: heavy metal translocating P-type ATPase metal-binding domain-containing protein [Candidatus Methylumidiphilus sp.]